MFFPVALQLDFWNEKAIEVCTIKEVSNLDTNQVVYRRFCAPSIRHTSLRRGDFNLCILLLLSHDGSPCCTKFKSETFEVRSNL